MKQENSSAVSNDLFELMKWMMHPEPEKRPTVDIILKNRHIKRILVKRNISHVIQCLVEPGKLLMSLLSFFGKVGYDVLMAALIKLRRLNQGLTSPMPVVSINDNVGNTEPPEVVTSTPVSERNYEYSCSTPSRFDDSWEISSCLDVSMEYDKQGVHDIPAATQIQEESIILHCRCLKRIRVHPYDDKFHQKVCNRCGGRKCTTVRNLTNEFSQLEDMED